MAVKILLAIVLCYLVIFCLLLALGKLLPSPTKVLIWVEKDNDRFWQNLPYEFEKYPHSAIWLAGEDKQMVDSFCKRYALGKWEKDLSEAEDFFDIVVVEKN